MRKIAHSLSAVDQRDFRLCCKRWSQLGRLCTTSIRLPSKAPWQEASQKARRVLSTIATVVYWQDCADLQDLAELLHNTACDSVCITPHQGALYKWSMDGWREQIVKATQTRRLLQRLKLELEGSTVCKRVQLILKVVASHARKPDMQTALAAVVSSITQLRIRESLSEFVNNTSQLSSLKVLAFTLPSTPGTILHCQTALLSLTTLESLQLFPTPQLSANRMCEFLHVLQKLPNVASVRIGTMAKPCCIPAVHLRHVTALELGVDVFVDAMPSKLVQLCFEGNLQVAAPYTDMFTQLQALKMPLSVSLQSVQPFWLQHLPYNLHSLILLHPTGEHSELLHAALTELHRLKVLHLGDFLTKEVVRLFADLVLPQVHTFGYRVHQFEAETSEHQMEYVYEESRYDQTLFQHNFRCAIQPDVEIKIVMLPARNILPLSIALPESRQVEVCFSSVGSCSQADLDCSVLNQLPDVRGLTCHCDNTWLHLRDVPTSCYGVVKSCSL